MSRAARELRQARVERNSARARFNMHLAQVRGDLAARGVGGRIADKVSDDARHALDEALEIADDNRGVLAGTIAALMLWIFRNPIISWTESLMGRAEES